MILDLVQKQIQKIAPKKMLCCMLSIFCSYLQTHRI
jgi:hypothetical protein